MAQMIFNPGQFTAQKAKPLPIILLLDVSSSMDIVTNPNDVRRTGRFGFEDGHQVEYVEGGITRISVLNEAVKKMLRTLAKYEREATEFLVGIITFGADTRLILPLSPAGDVRFVDLQAKGDTPLGKAIEIAKQIIEDKEQIPSRAFRPLVILVSDGEPNDDWQGKLDDFIANGRTAKCDRMALAISTEADRNMLGKFVAGTGHSVFEAETAEQITDFFKFVTMSTVQRTLSQNPNVVPKDSEVKQPEPPPPPKESVPKQPSQDIQTSIPTPKDNEDEEFW